MECPRCHSDNSQTARFCTNCGFTFKTGKKAQTKADVAPAPNGNVKSSNSKPSNSINYQNIIQNKKLIYAAAIVAVLLLIYSFGSSDGIFPGSNKPIGNFDYSNRYIHITHTRSQPSNTGNAIVDWASDLTNSVLDDAWQAAYDMENDVKDSLSVNWGFIPKKLTVRNNDIRVDGEFYNKNRYSTIANITDLKISLVDKDLNIVAMKEAKVDSGLQLKFDQNVPAYFIFSNVKKKADLSNFAFMISSSFKSIPDEEKLQREKPEVYAQAKAREQYYLGIAEKYHQKSVDLSNEYENKVNQYTRENAIDAATY